jgi:hypothetical protein
MSKRLGLKRRRLERRNHEMGRAESLRLFIAQTVTTVSTSCRLTSSSLVASPVAGGEERGGELITGRGVTSHSAPRGGGPSEVGRGEHGLDQRLGLCVPVAPGHKGCLGVLPLLRRELRPALPQESHGILAARGGRVRRHRQGGRGVPCGDPAEDEVRGCAEAMDLVGGEVQRMAREVTQHREQPRRCP